MVLGFAQPNPLRFFPLFRLEWEAKRKPGMISLIKAFVIVGLVLLNAFFVAAEYALLSVRRSRLEQLAEEGDTRAPLVLALLADVGLLFSGIQLGITVASLLMGWLGERIVAAAVERALEGTLSRMMSLVVAHSVSVGIAFLLITVLLMVLGELVPKALAYQRAERASLMLARPMLVFLRLTQHLVQALNWMANLVLRGLGQRPGGSSTLPHTAEEVKLIVSAIRSHGLLGEEQEEMIHSVFDLHQVRVREIMVPWPRAVCRPLTHDLGKLLRAIVESRVSRVPIYEGSPDHIVGILNSKDLIEVVQDRLQAGLPLAAPVDLRPLLKAPMIVPETMFLDRLLEETRQHRAQMALVVDEFGTYVGLVTLKDVLEQIVGKIHDEYDRAEESLARVSENTLLIDAAISIRDLAKEYEIELPREAGYETLAGFVLARLGVIPVGGETFAYADRRYTVAEMDGRRVAKVRIERLHPGGPAAQERLPASLPSV
jgi:CBS domain containing-hemolysin-like protein